MKFDEMTAETTSGNLRRARFWPLRFISALRMWNRPARKLRLCETVSLGNRGLLAVVRYQNQQFLLGCTNTSIAMLAQLADEPHTEAAGQHESPGER
jgi:flagellar biogenesis protein FliO